MEREVLSDARVVAWLARFEFRRVAFDDPAAPDAGLLRGVGTLVFDGDEPIARWLGVASSRAMLAFLAGAADAARQRRTAADGDEALRTCARCDLRLGFPERALRQIGRIARPSSSDLALSAAARLATGDVAGARAVIDRLDAAAAPLALRAGIALAERRNAEVVAMVRATATPDAPSRLLLARALLERDERQAAQAILQDLTAGTDAVAAEAEERLVECLGPGAAHAHR